MSRYKQFSQSLYDENDYTACDTVINHLVYKGIYAGRNDDKYGIDIIVYSGYKKSAYIEVEVKRVWKSTQEQFPWSHINLPERKGKYTSLRKPVEFWILREDMRKAVVIPISAVRTSELEEVPNKYIAEGEKFYKIDISKCEIIDIHIGEIHASA